MQSVSVTDLFPHSLSFLTNFLICPSLMRCGTHLPICMTLFSFFWRGGGIKCYVNFHLLWSSAIFLLLTVSCCKPIFLENYKIGTVHTYECPRWRETSIKVFTFRSQPSSNTYLAPSSRQGSTHSSRHSSRQGSRQTSPSGIVEVFVTKNKWKRQHFYNKLFAH